MGVRKYGAFSSTIPLTILHNKALTDLPVLILPPPTFLRPFFKLTIINILSNLLVPIAGLLDVAFLGHLAEVRHLAGVALATVLFNYLYWTFGFLRMSTTGMTAQAVGRQDEAGMVLIGLRHGILALLLGVAIVILQVPLRELGFAVLSASPEVKAAGQAFYNTLIWGAPATLINFVVMGWFLGRSQSGYVLILTAMNSLANVVLDYGLIIHLGWVSAGAGLVGILFAIAFIRYPDVLFARLTSHTQVLIYLKHYVLWLLPVLGFGSISYMLDGYFLGLTQGQILRQAMLQSVLIGFVPITLIAWYGQSNHWLWLALSLFMVMRSVTLGWRCLKPMNR